MARIVYVKKKVSKIIATAARLLLLSSGERGGWLAWTSFGVKRPA
jgi:hypothetical protein